ncbi:MAG TPA: N-acetylmuramic acid 6-phosphate etherase [Acidobacteriota bacterium]|jgi:N-acetylmuramic acid 6-phosphate etherase
MRSSEQTNPASQDLDLKNTTEVLKIINQEDCKVAPIVGQSIDSIATLVDAIYPRFAGGGRLFYVGAGTSGRLGVLDASEIPPTFGLPSDRVVGVIAGGVDALSRASEISEDDPTAGELDLRSFDISDRDSVIGIAASGRTPYTMGAVRFARSAGALTGCIVCVRNSELEKLAHQPVVLDTGPEILAGSTRMKAGTAQKLALNMISTALMIRMDLVYGNLMVYVHLTNQKLIERGKLIIMQACNVAAGAAARAIEQSGRNLPVALLMLRLNISPEKARRMLAEKSLRECLDET